MSVEIIPCGATMAAEVRGVDLGQQVDVELAETLSAAWHENILLLFRDQEMDNKKLKNSAAWLGDTSHISMPAERRGDDDIEIQNAMEYANEHYVEMKELLQKSGEYVAQMLGVEAAYITSGCAAALTLGTAGFMKGKDLYKMAQLPNTSGMKTDILIQKLH